MILYYFSTNESNAVVLVVDGVVLEFDISICNIEEKDCTGSIVLRS